MILKTRIPAGLWKQGVQSSTYIDSSKTRLDLAVLEKIGADVSFQFADIQPKKGYGYLHLISVGAGEFWGSNANQDYFNEREREWTLPFPARGVEKIAHLDAGLDGYHNATYLQHGGVYREHYNRRYNAPKLGDIVAAAVNPKMHRGELIVGLPVEKWAAELEEAAKGNPLFWSMGASVRRDMCSGCGHRRETLHDTCEHLRLYKNAVDENGNLICAINDAPIFHDISNVGRPADRIAFSLQKIASAEGPLHEDVELYLPTSFIQSTISGRIVNISSMLEKAAAEEKAMLDSCEGCGDVVCPVCGTGVLMNSMPSEELVNDLKGLPSDQLLGALSERDMVLPPKQFVEIMGKIPASEDLMGLLREILPAIFSKMKMGESLDGDGTFLTPCSMQNVRQTVKDHELELSAKPENVSHRVIRLVISFKPSDKKKEDKKEKVAAELETKAEYLAKEYAKYQLSFLARHPESAIVRYCVALNRC